MKHKFASLIAVASFSIVSSSLYRRNTIQNVIDDLNGLPICFQTCIKTGLKSASTIFDAAAVQIVCVALRDGDVARVISDADICATAACSIVDIETGNEIAITLNSDCSDFLTAESVPSSIAAAASAENNIFTVAAIVTNDVGAAATQDGSSGSGGLNTAAVVTDDAELTESVSVTVSVASSAETEVSVAGAVTTVATVAPVAASKTATVPSIATVSLTTATLFVTSTFVTTASLHSASVHHFLASGKLLFFLSVAL
ncbi:hypothetical protein HK100_001637 [Physocladia obscura]|uniref:Extracellular membrane protein CFEM domain-containing protein n=1 Tax=Physocladia obscura TaxID=109957 RepID=A0AAD5T953_9FUNG|nr:hypothetical protein HK100_001637 [Physocladia obscura]